MSEAKTFECAICRNQETKWRIVDEFRLKPADMSMCETCGFISYPSRATKEKLDAFYAGNQYRQPPTIANIFSGERKLHYHDAMLKELFQEWKAQGREKIVVTDVGSAFAQSLDWIRRQFPSGDYVGVELTKTYANVAHWFYGIRTIKEFDATKKYDLIQSYKSLEHIPDPDVELARYLAALKDDGILYLGVPLWFESLKNFGEGGFSLDGYFALPHINVWLYGHVRGLIEAFGGEIIKTNRSMYDTAWLIKRKPGVDPIELCKTADRSKAFEKPEKILGLLKKVFEAHELYTDKKFKKAFEVWPNFPTAYINHYEMNRATFDKIGFDMIYADFLLKAIDACEGDARADMHLFTADICSRYEKYNIAIEHCSVALEMMPGNPNALIILGNCQRSMANYSATPEDKIRFLETAAKTAKLLLQTSSQHRDLATSWLMSDLAQMPMPDEGK